MKAVLICSKTLKNENLLWVKKQHNIFVLVGNGFDVAVLN